MRPAPGHGEWRPAANRDQTLRSGRSWKRRRLTDSRGPDGLFHRSCVGLELPSGEQKTSLQISIHPDRATGSRVKRQPRPSFARHVSAGAWVKWWSHSSPVSVGPAGHIPNHEQSKTDKMKTISGAANLAQPIRTVLPPALPYATNQMAGRNEQIASASSWPPSNPI